MAASKRVIKIIAAILIQELTVDRAAELLGKMTQALVSKGLTSHSVAVTFEKLAEEIEEHR